MKKILGSYARFYVIDIFNIYYYISLILRHNRIHNDSSREKNIVCENLKLRYINSTSGLPCTHYYFTLLFLAMTS